MPDSISIHAAFLLDNTLTVALQTSIYSPLPLLVGYSLRWTKESEVVDIHPRLLVKPGSALWSIPVPDARCSNPILRFSIWKDNTFSERLADTGWADPFIQTASNPVEADRKRDAISSYGKESDAWML